MKKIFTISLSLVLGALISSAIFLWMASGEIYEYQDNFNASRDSAQIDVVLCLAGGKGRIPAAVKLWEKIKLVDRKIQPPVLFFSGVGAHANEETLIEQGVSKELVKSMKKEDVVFETVSTNTFENAQIFSSFVHQKKWKNILLVTAGYHMRRSTDILRKAVGPDVNIFVETVDAEHFDRNQWHKDPYAIRVTMMEYIKWLFYRYSY
jgi:uncharacterized SAM-binding protein YcdF (DUF218 family)